MIEVDFYVPDEASVLQASYSIQDDVTRRREVSALAALNRIAPLKRAMLITYDEEETLNEQGLTVEVIPIWKWLLQ